MKGHMGKILRIDLTDRRISTINTSDYEKWVGGHGIGSAIAFDLIDDWSIDGFDPKNVVTMMTSPLCGTLAPSGGGRTEVQGIGSFGWPINWFTRSNFGGRFSLMLKAAGWDGVVIEGKADSPVWVDIRNDDVQIRDASGLWGLDTYETQEEIWRQVSGSATFRNWWQVGSGRQAGRTTQRPAVVAIGPAGENLSRLGCLVHDAGNAGGQGGFGGVLGSKNLKAISAIGTGGVEIADPDALMAARKWIQDEHVINVDDPAMPSPIPNFQFWGLINLQPGYGPLILPFIEPSRPQGCVSCAFPCRRRTQSSTGNESHCVEALWYTGEGVANTIQQHQATDLCQKLGVNVYDPIGHPWLQALYEMGVMGPGKEIDTDLPFDQYGNYAFAEALINAIAYRQGIGDDLAEGWVRAAEKWGRLEDLATGILPHPQWGYHEHYDPRLEVEWSYGSILGDRDINEHCLNWFVHWMPFVTSMVGMEPLVSAEKMAETFASMGGLCDDPFMLNYSDDAEYGIYSEHKAKTIQFQRHYTRFWKQSVLYCDWAFPRVFNWNRADMRGFTPEAEPRIFNAVTGADLSFDEGMEKGGMIWNLDRSIWALQGRHRDMEVFSDYVYEVPTSSPYPLPVYENGEWSYSDNLDRTLDRELFEEWKTKYFALEGWNTDSGWPTRATLEGLSLGNVADKLEAAGKLG